MKATTCLVFAGILAGSQDGRALAADSQVGSVHEAADAPGYEGSGRRDPFVRPGSAPGTAATSCGLRGLEGVRARDLAVRGIVKTPEGFLALLVGPNGESHVARAGDRLRNGKVSSIEPAGVTLQEEAGSGDGRQQSRQVRVRLHAE